MREFTQLPDGGTRFETDSRSELIAVIRSTRRDGGTFKLSTGEGHGTYVGVIRGVNIKSSVSVDVAPVEETPAPPPVEEVPETQPVPAEEDLIGEVPEPTKRSRKKAEESDTV